MAIQFAFYRLHHTPGAHYESAGTRLYVHGRTDVIRSCSNESIAFSKAMLESKNDEEKVQKLKAAIESHKKYVNLAVQGQAIDRHLLGLKLIAKENGLAVPELYSDEGYVKSSTYRLSTSQVASSYEAFMCYGPLTYDGYGCCYSPRNNDIYFGLSSMRSNSDTSTAKFKKSKAFVLKIVFYFNRTLFRSSGSLTAYAAVVANGWRATNQEQVVKSVCSALQTLKDIIKINGGCYFFDTNFFNKIF